MVEQFAELRAEERRDDGRRRLVGPEPVGIARAHDARLDKSVVAVDAHQRLDDEHHEAQVVYRCLAGSVQQHPGVGREAPVVMLARAVDAGKRLLVEQHAEAVLARHLLHERHEQHVVVYGKVALFVYRGKLKLVGGHLVVARLARYGELQRLYLEVFHEGLHAVWYGAEVVVVHLLVLCALVTHQCPAREHKVRAGRIEPLVNQEVLLLPA